MTNFEGEGENCSITLPPEFMSDAKNAHTKRRQRRLRGRKTKTSKACKVSQSENANEPTDGERVDGSPGTKKNENEPRQYSSSFSIKAKNTDRAATPRNNPNQQRRYEPKEYSLPPNIRHRLSSRQKKITNQSQRHAYAALDLGTNNCRLLIAVPDGPRFRVIDAFSRIVRLGEGIALTGHLSQEAMDRALEALEICSRKLRTRGPKRQRLIATEACRVARNGADFLDRVKRETGLRLEIVTRKTEAHLALASCSSLIDFKHENVILFDIGGGSSEVVWLDLDTKKRTGCNLSDAIRHWTSLPVGVVNIAERYGGVAVTRSIFASMIKEVKDLLDQFPEAEILGKLAKQGRAHMLGASGTVTTLAGVHLGLKYYDRKKVDGLWMSNEDVTAITNRLLDMPFEERAMNACIGRDRADLVLAGCAILEALRSKWPCPKLRVADRGLREGILYELMIRDGVLQSPRNPASDNVKKSRKKTSKRCPKRRKKRAPNEHRAGE